MTYLTMMILISQAVSRHLMATVKDAPMKIMMLKFAPITHPLFSVIPCSFSFPY